MEMTGTQKEEARKSRDQGAIAATLSCYILYFEGEIRFCIVVVVVVVL